MVAVRRPRRGLPRHRRRHRGALRQPHRHKRARLRTIAHLAEDLDGYLTAPETLSLRQLLRLAPLIPRGYGDLLRATLDRHPGRRASRMARPPPDPRRGRTPRARGRHPSRAPAARAAPSTSAAAASASAASAPAPAGPCTSPAATPPATLSTASSTRSSACSARPSSASPTSTSRRRTAAADTSPGRAAPAGAPNSCLECANIGRPVDVCGHDEPVAPSESDCRELTRPFLPSARLRDRWFRVAHEDGVRRRTNRIVRLKGPG